MKKYLVLFGLLPVITGMFSLSGGAAENTGQLFGYRFASAEEGREILLANEEYFENLNQNDIDFRMQRKGASLEELKEFAGDQVLDFSDAEMAGVDKVMSEIGTICADRGYYPPATEGIVFIKTTMAEECGAGAYTHGTQIYLGEEVLSYAVIDIPYLNQYFSEVIAHELFHCLTRNHPEFRRAMYGILGFTVVEEDYEFSQEIRDMIISNPDVEHHNSYASFEINGEMKDCVVIFTTEPFQQPGDSFFNNMVTGLVPVDDLGTMINSEEASNFWEVFGRNTDYVIDPEETMADNFRMTIIYGTDGLEYESPEIITAIDSYLKNNAAEEKAA